MRLSRNGACDGPAMPRLPPFLLFVPLLASPASAAPLIGGFAPDLPGGEDDDAFELWNPGTTPVDLQQLTISDGEGTIGFPPVAQLPPGGRIIIALNATAYREAAGRNPDWGPEWKDGVPAFEWRETGLQLNRERDELLLWEGETLVDVVAWGDSVYSGEGWVGARFDIRGDPFLRWFPRRSAADTDTAQDWEHPQQPRLGWRAIGIDQSAFAIPSEGLAYTAPDHSRRILTELVTQAERSLRINVYEFRDAGLARLLLDRMAERPALEVRLLLDESPVGMDAEERVLRASIMTALTQAGADVRLFQHERYEFDHAKYAVADDRFVLIQSENFVPSGIPQDGRSGNRGWGLLIDHGRLAEALTELFEDDFEPDPYGARALSADDLTDIPLPVTGTAEPEPRLWTALAQGFNLTVLAGPESNLDENDIVVASIRAAQSTIEVEHLNVPPVWRERSGREWPNQYLEALLDAAERGVRVRILLDGHFLDESDNDNRATAKYVADIEGVEVRLAEDPDEAVLHVKGLVIDGRYSFVGSTNWNLNSVAQNRELTVRVDAPAFAQLYLDAFNYDWDRAEAVASEPTIPSAGAAATVICAALLALAMRPRRRPW